MANGKILIQLRSDADTQLFLMQDAGGLCLRRMWIKKTGEAKAITLPIDLQELQKLARYVEAMSVSMEPSVGSEISTT